MTRTQSSPDLILSDLDGTLVGKTDCISVRTHTVLASIVAQGMHLAVATGRPLRRISAFSRSLGFPCLVACANGALVYEPTAHRILACEEMSGPVIAGIEAAIRAAWPACEIAVERLNRVSGEFEQVLYAEEGAAKGWPAGDRARPVSAAMLSAKAAVKIMVRDQIRSSADMASHATRLLRDTADVTYANPKNGLIEISRLGINKGWAAMTLAEMLDMRANDIWAFGDMPNDIPMFRRSGYSVAVQNAHESVRAAADEITVSCEADGVAHVLGRWMSTEVNEAVPERPE